MTTTVDDGARAPVTRDRRDLTDHAIGAAIRARRRARGLLMRDVSAKTGIGVAVISRIELGDRPCRVPEMAVIAKALRTSATKLLDEASDIRPAQPIDGEADQG